MVQEAIEMKLPLLFLGNSRRAFLSPSVYIRIPYNCRCETCDLTDARIFQ